MPRIKYVGGIVGVDIPILGLTNVHPGAEFDVSDDVAVSMLASINYAPAGKSGGRPTDAQEG